MRTSRSSSIQFVRGEPVPEGAAQFLFGDAQRHMPVIVERPDREAGDPGRAVGRRRWNCVGLGTHHSVFGRSCRDRVVGGHVGALGESSTPLKGGGERTGETQGFPRYPLPAVFAAPVFRREAHDPKIEQ